VRAGDVVRQDADLAHRLDLTLVVVTTGRPGREELGVVEIGGRVAVSPGHACIIFYADRRAPVRTRQRLSRQESDPPPTLTIPDLNTRETAIVLWTAATLMVALATPSLRTILAEGVRIARQPLVRVLLTCTTVIAVVATGLLALLGYWQPSMLATTVAWFLGTAIVGTFSMGGVGELRDLILRVVAATALIEFVANAYTFPLLVELFVVAFVIAVVTLASFSELRPEFAILRRPFSVLCVALLVGTIRPTVVYVAHHLGELASAERTREFLLPLILTVALAPYLYCVRMTVVWQTALAMLGSEMADRPELLKAARRTMVRSCRLSLRRSFKMEGCGVGS
jgi:hypothetical protein